MGRLRPGQVVDTAMWAGASSLLAAFCGMRAAGTWSDSRAANPLDGGMACHGVYECADGGHIALGATEPQFWRRFCKLAGIDRDAPGASAAIRAELERTFRRDTRSGPSSGLR
ncbi:MAG: CoA transferase [Paracoccus sp. (in: a-proteobacteria)]|uniref:CoA transferase n=1 Tax=Paracoccus sp. TaxID=267 RepID=UPI0039E4FE53